MCKRIFTLIKIGHKYVFQINYSGMFYSAIRDFIAHMRLKKVTPHIWKSKCVNHLHDKTKRFFPNARMFKLELQNGLGKADAEFHVATYTICWQICQKCEAQACNISWIWSVLWSPRLNFTVHNYHPFSFCRLLEIYGSCSMTSAFSVASSLVFFFPTQRNFFWQPNWRFSNGRPIGLRQYFTVLHR